MSKKIVLGVSGSIAAYKAVSLVRLLIKSDYQVKVIMTPAATHFVSALTFATISKNDVSVDIIDKDTWNNHVELGLWADALLIAPATASTLSKLANGQSDNMLVATYLSAKCAVFIAPAMDLDMWKHPSTKSNLTALQSYGNHIIPVGNGELASGLVGDGRLAEPADILQFLNDALQVKQDLIGKKIIITAGPTKEALDPVRFISNHSTGRMGICLAEECVKRGARVTLILGPTSLSCQTTGVKTISVVSAQEMYDAATKHFKDSDIAIMAAAVADYRPKTLSVQKIKKKDDDMSIALERTPDIAKALGASKSKGQYTIGFALETQNGLANAKGKLERKNFDLIVLNSLSDKGAGFKHNTNKVSIVNKNGDVQEYPLKSKMAVAKDIINQLISII